MTLPPLFLLLLDASSPASQAGRQPVMGPCSEDPHLCGASRLLGFTSLLLSEWMGLQGGRTTEGNMRRGLFFMSLVFGGQKDKTVW